MKARFFLLVIFTLSLAAFGQGKGKGHNKQNNNDANPLKDDEYRVLYNSQRDSIRGCLTSNREGLPPGLAKRDRLPPGLERQLRKNGKLPPGLQKKVQPLPSQCQTNLPRLPDGWERVVLNDRVMVLDPAKRIIDWFNYTLGRGN